MIINKTLSNGVRVAVVPIPGLRAVTIEVLVKIGAKYETASEHGLSHFLEHMAFKGTVKRPNPTDIFREMDVRGVDYNAETGLENTSYSITTVRDNLEWALEMLQDILFNSTIPVEEVEKERGVICEEIKMYKDNPMMGLASEMMSFLYDSSEIGCWNISGEVNQITKVNRDTLVEFKKKNFNTEEMVIVLAGNVVEKDLELVEKFFTEKVAGAKKTKSLINLSKELNGEERRQVEQSHFVVAIPTRGWSNPERYHLRLLDLVMVGNSSSRLFEEIRTKRGWAYYVYSVSENIKEAGMWGVQAGVSSIKINEAVELVKEVLESSTKTITDVELNRAKTYIKGRIELNLDQSEFWSGYIGEKWLLEERLVTPTEELAKLEAVKLEEIKDVAEHLFVRGEMRTLSVLAN